MDSESKHLPSLEEPSLLNPVIFSPSALLGITSVQKLDEHNENDSDLRQPAVQNTVVSTHHQSALFFHPSSAAYFYQKPFHHFPVALPSCLQPDPPSSSFTLISASRSLQLSSTTRLFLLSSAHPKNNPAALVRSFIIDVSAAAGSIKIGGQFSLH